MGDKSKNNSALKCTVKKKLCVVAPTVILAYHTTFWDTFLILSEQHIPNRKQKV